MKKSLSVLAMSMLGVSMIAAPAFAAHEGTAYSGSLNGLNNEPGSGSSYIEVSEDGSIMTVTVDASNLELDFAHAMHIHGIYSGDLTDAPADGSFSASSCPTFADDTNDDGILTVVEGAGKYGDVLVSLTTTGDTSAAAALAVGLSGDNMYGDSTGTSIDYERDITIPSAMKDELAKVHIVVHGTDVDDNGDVTNDDGVESSLAPGVPVDGTAPALCGTLTAVSAGAVQTGAGGTATDNGAALVLGAGALAMAGAVAIRRRAVQA